MKITYVNRLPKNEEVKNTNVRIENGELVVEVEFKDEFEPNDGDFVIDNYGDVFIYNKKLSTRFSGGCYVGYNSKWNEWVFGVWNHSYIERLATPEEKSAFIERLEKECHKRWNPETNQLEDIRWRAAQEQKYYVVSDLCEIISYRDYRNKTDDEAYKLGNYFLTPEAAQKVADQIKEIFKNSKAE